jgi:putative glutamine amidotransferase
MPFTATSHDKGQQEPDMSKPLIGLTTYGIANSPGYNIPAEYVLAIERAGGVPLLLPPIDPGVVDRWFPLLRGLVLIGGGDIDPARYGAASHASIYNLDAVRDTFELALARRAIDRQLPTLAICRGMQVVNVLRGGTLHRHLPEVVGEKILHRRPPRETTRHAVTVDAGTFVAEAMQAIRVDIVSWHHQAVDRLGEGLRAVAWSEDGVVEAMEFVGNPHLLAVQWHPELSADTDPTQQRLFDWLVMQASRPSAAFTKG